MMKSLNMKILAGALALGSLALMALPASAAPTMRDGVSPMILVASGGWAARTSGHQSTYGSPYGYDEGFGYGYAPYQYARPYAARPYGYGAPQGPTYYGEQDRYDAY